MIFGTKQCGNIIKKLDLNDYSFVRLTLILLLHYLVKCISRSWPFVFNEFIPGSACVGSENHSDHKIIENPLLIFNSNRIHFKTVRRRTETTHQQRVRRSESRGY